MRANDKRKAEQERIELRSAKSRIKEMSHAGRDGSWGTGQGVGGEVVTIMTYLNDFGNAC